MSDLKKIGRYNVQSLLGEGAMGSVFRALDPNIGRTVAIKIVKIDLNDADNLDAVGFRERFQQEARISGNLSHPNIVSVYDVDQHDGMPYIAMEFVEGQTLAQYIRSDRKLTPGEMVNLLVQLAGALDFAHGRGVVHRDLKPANIMVSKEGVPKIMDFGIAKMSGSNLTQTGMFLGTPSYSSPEQIKEGLVDYRSDIFSFGILACEVLTGKLPFPGKTIHNILFKIANEPPTFREDLEFLEIPAASFYKVFNKVLHKDPSQRYPSASSFAQELLNIMALGANDRQRLTQTASHLATVVANAGLARPLERSEFEHQGAAPMDRTVMAGLPPRSNTGAASASIAAANRSNRWLIAIIVLLFLGLGIGLALYKLGYLGSLPIPELTQPLIEPKQEPVVVLPKTLSFNSNPPGAQVFEGATLLGVTPFNFVWEGAVNDSKQLIARLEGFKDASLTLKFNDKQSPQIDISLTKLPVLRSLTSTPAGATISVDGTELLGETLEYSFVPGQSYQIAWVKEGFLGTRITYIEGETDPKLLGQTLPAKPPPGSLVVDTDFSDLVVTADGQRVSLPASLEPGTYKVRLSSEKYFYEDTRTVRIQSKSREQLATPILINIPKLDFIGGYVNVRINGRLVRKGGEADTTPMIDLALPAGPNQFEFVDPSGKIVLKKTINIQRSENLVVSADP